MKKLFYLFAFFTVVLSSCSSEEENSSNTVSKLIKKMITSSNGSNTTFNYVYNGSKLKEIRINNDNVAKYKYVGDNITSIENYLNGSLFYKTTFQYDNNQRVISQLEHYIGNNIIAERTDFSYDLNNIISFQKYYGSISSQTTIGESGFIYHDSNNENFKVETYNEWYLIKKTEWTYDTKNSPTKNIKGLNKQPFIFGKYFNFITSKEFDSNDNLINNLTYEYMYDSEDFPTSCIQEYFENGNLQSTSNITYFY